ncbi:RidA family protein [Denitromonas ohlonensis]|uniref:RidA family protein n=2 Tax=Denitromonas TaxID=139331 RepID=A0A557SID1_9RHOO|nr:RidA family protein [Denitromonas ohlonensis]TVT49147.1 MAG: RidA family protein [Denitromonas halophila]TVO69088.1 RidA family protein [Denitromonas ohlonensis]TVO77188.1 RidA family protein [Denitromonas ohlonensis]TVT72024.1 MAG: RidA family protein [Denitromonas halophila]TVT78188.1 MAG: RidA family protein [Denitromonas halophila]
MSEIERMHTGPRMSKIVRHGGLVYLCGQTAGGIDEPGDVTAQTTEMLSRVDRLLTEAGSDRGRILSALIHVTDMADFAAMNAVWEAWLPEGAAPARTTVEARLASPALRVEITIVAAV